MPVYEFKCAHCETVFSELRRMGDYVPSPCPECGSGDTEKIFSLFAGTGSSRDCGTCSAKPAGG